MGLSCLKCHARIAECLLRLGSLVCHDCRHPKDKP